MPPRLLAALWGLARARGASRLQGRPISECHVEQLISTPIFISANLRENENFLVMFRGKPVCKRLRWRVKRLIMPRQTAFFDANCEAFAPKQRRWHTRRHHGLNQHDPQKLVLRQKPAPFTSKEIEPIVIEKCGRAHSHSPNPAGDGNTRAANGAC